LDRINKQHEPYLIVISFQTHLWIGKYFYQSFDDKEVYPSAEEKSSHLLYLIVKTMHSVMAITHVAAIFIFFVAGHGAFILTMVARA